MPVRTSWILHRAKFLLGTFLLSLLAAQKARTPHRHHVPAHVSAGLFASCTAANVCAMGIEVEKPRRPGVNANVQIGAISMMRSVLAA